MKEKKIRKITKIVITDRLLKELEWDTDESIGQRCPPRERWRISGTGGGYTLWGKSQVVGP